jgi:hypothetical protein
MEKDGHRSTARQAHSGPELPARRVLLLGALALGLAGTSRVHAASATAEVWKSPTCACCQDWIAHMESNGFEVRVHDTGNAATRARLGVAQKYGSCHTALVDGYAIEGHVPASEVRRLLEERPAAVGLAVPGMPIGAPGMDGPVYRGRRDPYDVLLLKADGSASVYRRYA